MVAAPSNSAARNGGGDTVHSCCSVNGSCNFRLNTMGRVSAQAKDALKEVEVLIADELSMVCPMMLGGLSCRAALARHGTRPSRWPEVLRACDPMHYSTPVCAFGGIPLATLTRDFLAVHWYEQGTASGHEAQSSSRDR